MKLIESIENKKQTTERVAMLDKLSLKSKSATNISVIKDDPQDREDKFLAEKEINEDSKINLDGALQFKKSRALRNTT
jgi:hypothetical protein